MKALNSFVKKYWILCIITIISLFTIQILVGSVCLSVILIGIPCPACGITRATLLLLTGNFYESFQMHPLLIIVFVGAVLYLIIKRKLNNFRFFIKTYVILGVLIFVVFYIYRLQVYYPNLEPMVYREDNLLANIHTLIKYIKQH